MKPLLFMLLVLFAGLGLAQGQGWQKIEPGGQTACVDGSPYAYYVQKGDPSKLIIDFQGGGACWDNGTCGANIYKKNNQAPEIAGGQGIYNRSNPDNPFKDWTHVFVTYCSADIHLGNAERTYGNLSVQHRGQLNTRAALSWVYVNVPKPQSILVTGCSAGAYGAAMWAPFLMRRYPEAKVAQFGDSGAGVLTPAFPTQGFVNWNISGAVPAWIPSLYRFSQKPDGFTLNTVYSEVGKAYPKNAVAQYNTALDGTQIFFYGLMKGEAQPSQTTAVEWATRMVQSKQAINSQTPNFSFYIAPGSRHCILPFPEFYSTNVGGVKLTDWLRKLVETGDAGDVVPPR